MEDVLLTVIVPVYNVAPWLSRCLDSILAQTYNNIEIIVIDDGSKDDSPRIVDYYAHKYRRIRVIHQENKGLVATRERGIREAKGSFIGFVDGDDEIIPEMYEKLIKNALLFNAQISQCGILCIHQNGHKQLFHGTKERTVFNRLDGLAALLRGEQMEPSLCNKIYRSSLLRDSCLDPSIVNNEDMLRNAVLFNRAECSVLEDFCGYIYWRHSESMSCNKNSEEIVRNVLRARKAIVDYVPTEVKKIAIENYIQGAVRCYNILLFSRSEHSGELKLECKTILRDSMLNKGERSRREQFRLFLIVYFSSLYDLIEILHVRIRKMKKVWGRNKT